METKEVITVETVINANVEKVWEYWTNPLHLTNWAFASDDWHAPYADNDLRVGGKFKTTMAAKDGSFSFDFEGVYTEVKEHSLIAYTIADGRKVKVDFISQGTTTKLIEAFEAESENSVEMQKGGWQSILDNFRKYTEAN